MQSEHPLVYEIDTEVARIWIAFQPQYDVQYYYGGTRLVLSDTTDVEVHTHLRRLMQEESQLKNRLINKVLSDEHFVLGQEQLPKGVAKSRVGGGRCLIRPSNDELYAVFSNPAHARFHEVIDCAFKSIGRVLNELEGIVKLIPDFGRFADCSNHLYRYTNHVLGIGCDLGGCGGKSSYSTSGIVGGMRCAGLFDDPSAPTLLIGSAGALGSEILEYLKGKGFRNVTLCDLQYDTGDAVPPVGFPVITSRPGRFTEKAMRHGGIVIATTWGHELEHSRHDLLPTGTRLILAHNLCLPAGDAGRELARGLHQAGVLAIPGALLTLGGALTSRLEWFHRGESMASAFDKEFAHNVAHEVVARLTAEVLRVASERRLSPFEAMHAVADDAVA